MPRSLERPFSHHLRVLLARSGLSQAEIARRADIDQSSVSRYLQGATEPNLKQARALAQALGVHTSALLGDVVDVTAIRSNGCCLLFRGRSLVGEWRGGDGVRVLHLRVLDPEDPSARELLRRARNGGRPPRDARA